MGYHAEELVKAIVPSAAITLVEYFTRSVQNSDPIDCVGYSYMLERLSLRVAEEYIQRVEALFPPEINATRCLRVHSSVGSDTEHVEETVEMVAELSERERTRVALACYETALLSFCPPREGYLSPEQLQELLKPFKLENSW
jgi:pyrroloquinoline quinone (PQQ) biosynthesis protein C